MAQKCGIVPPVRRVPLGTRAKGLLKSTKPPGQQLLWEIAR